MVQHYQEIEQAVAHYRALLESQISRAEEMDAGSDAPRRDHVVIGLADGDGIGPIIMAQASRALRSLLAEEISDGRVELRPIQGLTLENRIKQNQAVPAEVLDAIKDCDVLLKGPTTTPCGGTLESANVALRRELDLFANVRPVSVPEKGIDWTFFRENTEGEYTLGSKGVEISDLLTMDFKVTTIAGTRRIAKAAFEFAKNNGKTHVTIVTKANIMKKTDALFSRICHEVAKDYPGIAVDEYYIDIMAANLINPALRHQFQVIVMPNLYGDILTDEAAQIQGGVDTAGSANTGGRYAMFEAVHGSAPRMFEEGLQDYANPESILRAAVMLLRHIGLPDKADHLEKAIARAAALCPVNGTREGNTCQAYGDCLLSIL